MMYYGFDWTYILVMIGALLCIFASSHVTSTYNRYARTRSACGMTGAQVAQEILRRNGVSDVTVQHVAGNLTDHYNPATQTVNLSDSVYGSTSVAAVAVAAHECGHVMQHETGYVPLSIRTALVPIANFGSNAGIWIVMLGFLMGLSDKIVTLGILLFSLGVLFQVVTLPVEFNASRRALSMLDSYGILSSDEVGKSREVLTAAALTYVASAASSVLSLLRLIFLNNRRRSD
ncbi:MAG: zinc metallopeptidase [Lachnospiraceae bacterium]|nr:zinc metallopeptidase [Lachnospiraceae bacterium]